jgi:hypothetical protein
MWCSLLTYNKLFADEVFTVSPPLAGAVVRAENIGGASIGEWRMWNGKSGDGANSLLAFASARTIKVAEWLDIPLNKTKKS